MQLKSERQLLSSTSKRVLRQLQENQSLRIQLFRVRSQLRDQHHHFLNSTVNQEMLIQKIITELCLGVKRAKEVRHRGENEILYNVIEHSLGDLHCILDSYGKIRGDWAKSKPDASEVYYERMLKDCSAKFDSAQQAIDELSKEKQRINEENSLKNAQIQFLQGQLGKLKQKYDQSMQEVSAIRTQKSKLSQTVSDAQLRLNQYAEEVAKLKATNDTLSHSLKESREVANRHTEYLSNKCEGIQLENKRLIEMQKDQNIKQQQMTKVAAENEKQIQRLSQETHKLRMEIHSLQHKFKEIIDKENKIKHLESNKPKKHQTRQALCDLPLSTQNTIPSQQKQRTFKKEVGKMTNKKFNLQAFHQQLTTSTSTSSSSTSFFPH